MRISRRFMALALTLCLALTMIPGMAMAAGVTVADAAGLTNAINAAAGETTITLTADITTTSALIIDKNGCDIILDLGGKTLTARINLKGGNLTIKNGTVSLPGGQPLNVYADQIDESDVTTKLTVAADATVEGKYSVVLFGYEASEPYAYNAQVDIYGNVNGTVFVSGNIDYSDSVININSPAKVEANNDGKSVGIALNGNATVNVEAGTEVKGASAVEVRAGKLNITGGTFTATGDSFSARPNSSGTTTTGAAVAVSSYNNSNIVVDISGGTFKGATAFGEIYTKEGEPEPEKVKISITGGDFTGAVSNEFEKGFISGGTFNESPRSDLIVEGKAAVDVGNGKEGTPFTIEDAMTFGDITIAPASLDFGTVKVGYTQPAPQTVSIKGTSGDSFKLEAKGDGYIIKGDDNSNEITVDNDGIAKFTVQPKAGLGAGVYDVIINVINVSGTTPPPATETPGIPVDSFIGLFFSRALASTAPGITVKFRVDPASSGSGISVKYTGGNGFSSSKPDVPTGVEIDGVPVSFTGDGRNFTVSCIKPDSRWITVRWNSTSVTTNFTPDAAAYCSPTNIPKTGDASLAAFVVMAIAAAAGAMRRK